MGSPRSLAGIGAGVARHAAELATSVVDLVLPPRCLACGTMVAATNRVCAACWHKLRFVAEPLCEACGHPLPYALAAQHDCRHCATAPSSLTRIRVALAYDDASRGLILGFKHAGRIETAGLFAGWMREAGRELLADADWLIPVPLHRWRLLHRGFNQSGLLATRIGRLTGVPVAVDWLQRKTATRSQQGLNRASREKNITAEAFSLRPRAVAQLEGKRVILIDDVLTTGATLGACAATLKAHGAAQVDALALARVVRDGIEPI
jgi:ComF family protein